VIYVLTHYWIFAALAALLGAAVGWFTCGAPREGRLGWLTWGLAALALGAVVALAAVLPGFAGHALEVALLLFAAYLVGCLIGCMLKPVPGAAALEGDARPLAARQSAEAKDWGGAPPRGDRGKRKEAGKKDIGKTAALAGAGLAAGAAANSARAARDAAKAKAKAEADAKSHAKFLEEEAARAKAEAERLAREEAHAEAKARKAAELAAREESLAREGKSSPPARDFSVAKGDALTLIGKIGPHAEGKLNALGIRKFAQIAAWTPSNGRWIDEQLGEPGRVAREDWAAQAAVLARGELTDYARAVRAGTTHVDDAPAAPAKAAKEKASHAHEKAAGAKPVGDEAKTGAKSGAKTDAEDGAVVAGAAAGKAAAPERAASAPSDASGPASLMAGSARESATSEAEDAPRDGDEAAKAAATGQPATEGDEDEGAPARACVLAPVAPAPRAEAGHGGLPPDVDVSGKAAGLGRPAAPAMLAAPSALALGPATQTALAPAALAVTAASPAAAPEVAASDGDADRPPRDDGARAADDLTWIAGIGPVNARALDALGVRRFAQIAAWTPENGDWISRRLAFPGRVAREGWVAQARLLAAGVVTDHAQAVRSGVLAPEDAAMDADAAERLLAALPRAADPLEGEARHEGARPLGLAAARGDTPDNLTLIRGVGRQNERRLHELGIWHFDQIAAWTPENVKWVGSWLAFPGRIDREDWIAQAIRLARGELTDFAQRVKKGDVPTSHN
jgi:predicted flap endonuclease-1-like 5' DNA nuclease